MSQIKLVEHSSDDYALSAWSERDKRAVKYTLPKTVQKRAIDYDKLRELNKILDGEIADSAASSEDIHKHFMREYPSIFVQPSSTSGESSDQKTKHRENSKPNEPEEPKDTSSHDIRDYLPLIHRQKKQKNPADVKAEKIQCLRTLLKKRPFQRSTSENDKIYKVLRHFLCISDQCSPHVLRQLCMTAHLDVWKEKDITIPGNTGFHMILSGRVKPLTYPYCLKVGQQFDVPCPTPHLESVNDLEIGDWFGTLEQIKDRGANSMVLTVKTVEEECEFLKIACSDYSRVVEKNHLKDQNEKLELLHKCETFKLWSRQPLLELTGVLAWVHYPANTVLTSEGCCSPFAGIIKSGECDILKTVKVNQPPHNRNQEVKEAFVAVGKLAAHDSFGEVSCVTSEPMPYSIVTNTAVELCVVEPEKLADVDEVTRKLLSQSGERSQKQFTSKEVHEKYVNQELRREWDSYKQFVISDTINTRGIRPGHGKWSK